MSRNAPKPGRAATPAIRGSTLEVAMKPQRRWLAVLLAAFALWVGYLLAIYFATVYPQRHGGSSSPPMQQVDGASRP